MITHTDMSRGITWDSRRRRAVVLQPVDRSTVVPYIIEPLLENTALAEATNLLIAVLLRFQEEVQGLYTLNEEGALTYQTAIAVRAIDKRIVHALLNLTRDLDKGLPRLQITDSQRTEIVTTTLAYVLKDKLGFHDEMFLNPRELSSAVESSRSWRQKKLKVIIREAVRRSIQRRNFLEKLPKSIIHKLLDMFTRSLRN